MDPSVLKQQKWKSLESGAAFTTQALFEVKFDWVSV